MTIRSMPAGPKQEFLRYVAVSAAALLVDVATLYLMAVVLQFDEAASTVIAYFVGLAAHYLLSIRLVFAFRRFGDRRRVELALYLASGVLGALFSGGVVRVALAAGLTLVVAKGIAVAGSFVLVYALRKAMLFTTGKGAGA